MTAFVARAEAETGRVDVLVNTAGGVAGQVNRPVEEVSDADWRVIFVGDAAMSPYELTAVDGSVEYRNIEPGLKWLGRIFGHFRKVIWWNPEPVRGWEYTRSTQLILQALGPRMFPLTLDGVARGIDALRK